MTNTIRVYSYKEGLLARLAHDLQLTLTRFSIVQKGRSIVGLFEPASLRVDGAMKDGSLDAGELSASDLEKIHGNLTRDVLHTERFPQAKFEGHVDGEKPPLWVRGELSLCGITSPLAMELQREGNRLQGRVELIPSRFGIKPFRALGGTLRVQDRVLVEVDVDAGMFDRDGLREAAEHTFMPS